MISDEQLNDFLTRTELARYDFREDPSITIDKQELWDVARELIEARKKIKEWEQSVAKREAYIKKLEWDIETVIPALRQQVREWRILCTRFADDALVGRVANMNVYKALIEKYKQ